MPGGRLTHPALALAVACSACGSSGVGSVDASPPREADGADRTMAPKDVGPVNDAGELESAPVAVDASGAPVPAGVTIDTGSDFAIQGVTSDGYVIYVTDTAVKAAPVAGGPPTTLVTAGDAGASFGALVSASVVFLWTNLSQSSGAGTLSVWTHAAGVVTELSTTSVGGVAAASADGSTIVFSAGASRTSATGDLFGASLAALTTPVSLATAVDLSGQICPVSLAFSGANAVASFCSVGDAGAAVDAGGSSPLSVYTYPTSTWLPQTLATNAVSFQADTTGGLSAIATASGQLEIAAAGVTAPVLIDSVGTLATLPAFYMSKTDRFVLYATASSALRTSPVTSSAPVTLVPTDVNGIDGTSPDEAWVLVNNNTDSNTGFPSDLGLASTALAGTPVSLTTGTTVAAALGDAFTADSRYALFMTNISVDDNENATGTLNAVATGGADGGAPTIVPLAKAAVNDSNYSPSDLALTGSRVSFTDNFNPASGNTGSVDLHVIDLSATAPSTIVMKGADPGYFVSADRQYVLYTITFGGPTDGIYSIRVP